MIIIIIFIIISSLYGFQLYIICNYINYKITNKIKEWRLIET